MSKPGDSLMQGFKDFGRVAQPRKTQASADFMDADDVAKLAYEKGRFLLGRFGDGYDDLIGYQDGKHIVTIGGTRGGKGISAILPNLCEYPGSVVCMDPKGENATITAMRRGNGSEYCDGLKQKVVVLDPFKVADVPGEIRGYYNPLDTIDLGNLDAISRAKKIAESVIIVSDPKDGHFDESARHFLAALILYVKAAEPPEDQNLRRVRVLLTRGNVELAIETERILKEENPDGPNPEVSAFDCLIAHMKECKDLDGFISSGAETFSQVAPEEKSGFLSFARRNTAFLDEPRIIESLSKSTFTFDKLKRQPGGLSIYICHPIEEMVNDPRWTRLLLMECFKEIQNTGKGPGATGAPVLIILDEFFQLGYMKILESAAGYIAGFGAKLWVVLQDLNQIRGLYKDTWETFLGNAGVLQCFSNDDTTTLEYLSKKMGHTEVRQVIRNASRTDSVSNSTNQSASKGNGGSKSYQKGGAQSGYSDGTNWSASTQTGSGKTEGRAETSGISEQISVAPLMRPEEIKSAVAEESGRQIVFLTGRPAFFIDRVRYYDDPHFDSKFDPDPAHPSTRPQTLAQKNLALLEADHAQRRALVKVAIIAKAEKKKKWARVKVLGAIALLALLIGFVWVSFV